MGALQFVDVPGYAALVLRRSYPELTRSGGLIDVAHRWLGPTDAEWSAQERRWRFPSGAVLQFGHMEYEETKYDYDGSEWQYIAFDELTEFTASQYTYMFSRWTRPVSGPLASVPLRMRSGTNPGGPGHDWVKARFIDGDEPGAVFIPARLEDNPHVDQPSYEAGLRKMTDAEYQQKRHGDWIKAQGGQMRGEMFTVIDEHPRSPSAIRVWDLAASAPKPGRDPDWTVGALVDLDAQGRLVIHHIRRLRATPADVEAAVRQEAELDGTAVPVWIEEEGGASGKSLVDQYQRRVLVGTNGARWTLKGFRQSKDKYVRANPFIAMVQRGNVLLVRGAWNRAFIDECESFGLDDVGRPLGAHDDQVDAVATSLGLLRPRRPTAVADFSSLTLSSTLRR